jgi:hypothetical protein
MSRVLRDVNGDKLEVLTEQGRKVLRDDTQMDIEYRLILEIMSRCPGGISQPNMDLVYFELVRVYGGVAEAIEALKSDDVEFYNPIEER